MSEIIITICEGSAHLYRAEPGVRVIIRDYDVPADWDADDGSCEYDEMLERYQKIVLTRP